MIIDTTTHNKIHNPTSVQGQWYQHRWGRRNYPLISLSYDDLMLCLNNHDGFIDVPLSYGDVSEYEYFITLSNEAANKLHLNSYGMFKLFQTGYINSNFNNVTIHLDGWDDTTGKVFLGANADVIKRSISKIDKINVIYYCYQHNVKSIKEMADYCIANNANIKFVSGPVYNGENSHPVITKDCEWLYDVHSYTVDTDQLYSAENIDSFVDSLRIDNDYELRKSLYTYNTLRTYVKKPKGRRITEFPIIPKIFPNQQLKLKLVQKLAQKDSLCVTPTGHVFRSYNMMNAFMQFLADDWSFDVRSISHYDEFMLDLLASAQEIMRYGLNGHTVEKVFTSQSE